MKNIQRKIICTILGVLLCLSLSGCTIGEYAVCDFYTDGNGDLHFMMLGKHNMEEAEAIEDIQEDGTLFSIHMKQEKEVTISYDILLSDGACQLVYISPDDTEQLLTDEQTAWSDKQLKLTQGENKIVMVSDNAVFQKIDIAIAGIEVSDFN